MDTAEFVGYERRGPVVLLSLNRPDKLNAIDGAVIDALLRGMDRAEADADCRVVIIRGLGRAFSAGFDLNETFAPDGVEPTVRAECERDFRLIMRFWDSPLPTIAAVHGYCLGGAFELSLACDITIAAEDSLLGAPEARIGSGIVALLLPWVCGPKRAREILLAGMDRISAADAERFGIVNRVVAPGELLDEALALAEQIAGNDRFAVRHIKLAINGGYDQCGLRDALAQGLEACITIESESQTRKST